MTLLFDVPSFLNGLETEAVILCVVIFFSTQWQYYANQRTFYNRSNKFEDFYEMHKHFLENKVIYQMNERILNELKCSVNEMKEELIHIKHDIAYNLKNQAEPNKLILEFISDIREKLDNKDGKNK